VNVEALRDLVIYMKDNGTIENIPIEVVYDSLGQMIIDDASLREINVVVIHRNMDGMPKVKRGMMCEYLVKGGIDYYKLGSHEHLQRTFVGVNEYIYDVMSQDIKVTDSNNVHYVVDDCSNNRRDIDIDVDVTFFKQVCSNVNMLRIVIEKDNSIKFLYREGFRDCVRYI